jgi:SAM-dependent methyltransferase
MNKKVKDQLKKILHDAEFGHSVLGFFYNPFYLTRRALHKKIRSYSGYINGNVLDIGCGSKPYKSFFNYSEYTGIDTDTSGHVHKKEEIDIFFDGKKIPFKNENFDSAVCFEVIEHVFTPAELLSEINRVLKKESHFLVTLPFSWDEHEQPFDYARYSSFGITHLLESNGFLVIEKTKSLNDIRAVFQILICYMFKSLRFFHRWLLLSLITGFIFYFPLNLLAQVLFYITPKNNDFYIDNIILAKKK